MMVKSLCTSREDGTNLKKKAKGMRAKKGERFKRGDQGNDSVGMS